MPPISRRIVRHDLMCDNVPAATHFYQELFSWKTTQLQVMGMNIVRLLVGDRVLGAIMPFPKTAGFPSHWVPYMNVSNVDKCCAQVPKLGGQVCMGAMDITPGRFALANDKEGALFSPFVPKQAIPPNPEGADAVDHFCWDELHTTDVASARAFYTALLGWASSEYDQGPLGMYTLFLDGKSSFGGAVPLASGDGDRPLWLPYVAVADADVAAARAVSLGATLVRPLIDVPSVGRLGTLVDPTGARIAILESKR